MSSICTKPLTAGEVIFECKPLIHVLDLEFKAKFCNNCAERSDQLKRCSKCLQMFYCDKSCQSMDWKYHKNECKVFRSKAFDPKECSLEERLFLRFWFCIKSDETFATKRHQLFDGSDVCLNDIEVKGLALKEESMVDFKDFLRHFINYGIAFNRKQLFHWFGVFATICSNIKGFFTRIKSVGYLIGFGLYLQLSHISHSCIPNTAVVNTKGLSLQLRAMKSIGFGEEITRSYISLAQNKIERQTKLKTNYLFNCKCDKCWLNLDSEVDYQLINYFNNRLIVNNWIHIRPESLFRLTSKLISFYNTIYGEYNPEKTLKLLNILSYFLVNNDSNEEFVNQLIDTIESSLRVTNEDNDSISDHFNQLRLNQCSDKLFIP